MFKRIIAAFAVFFALVVAYGFVGGVSKMDISLKHDMQRHVVDEPFEAGDIIEVSPDGQRVVGMLCDVNLPRENWANASVSARYYNVIDASQPLVLNFLANAVRVFMPETAEQWASQSRQSEGLDFVGEKRRIVGNIEGNISTGCHCDVARAVLERKAVACIVEKSLVETERSVGPLGPIVNLTTVAVSFRETPVGYHDPLALAPFCPDLNTLARPPVGQSCAGDFGYSPDVRARGKFGLIREAALETDVVELADPVAMSEE